MSIMTATRLFHTSALQWFKQEKKSLKRNLKFLKQLILDLHWCSLECSCLDQPPTLNLPTVHDKEQVWLQRETGHAFNIFRPELSVKKID